MSILAICPQIFVSWTWLSLLMDNKLRHQLLTKLSGCGMRPQARSYSLSNWMTLTKFHASCFLLMGCLLLWEYQYAFTYGIHHLESNSPHHLRVMRTQ